MKTKTVTSDIKLLYLSQSDAPGFMPLLAGRQNWQVRREPFLGNCQDLVQVYLPRVVVLELCPENHDSIRDMISAITGKVPGPRAVVLAVADRDPGPDIRYDILSAGASDIMAAPFSCQEVELRIKRILHQGDTDRELEWTKKRFDKALGYIQAFKTKLVQTRKIFVREKNLLHNSLKQLTIMTNEREHLRSRLKEMEQDSRKSRQGMEAFLIHMLELRNEHSMGHEKRVADIAGSVSARFDFEPGECETLRTAALLHEIGMLLIPDSVYCKDDSRRTAYEEAMMAHQASRGAGLLAACPGFEAVAHIIRYLNEKVDGSGVPEGLKRRNIPLASRIIAGADRLDNLWRQQDRPSLEALLQILESEAGTGLDPNVVNGLSQYAATRLYMETDAVREVGVHQLQPGMITGAGLFTVTGTKLFSAGTMLTRESIDLLARYTREYPVEETVFIRVN
ncbi:MAG: HD domain-containing phosphohydrolase [Pseudomonadota bacterium]